MNVHFLHTSGGFPYSYYLAVLSALRTQTGTVTVYSHSKRGKYLDVLRAIQPPRFKVQSLPVSFDKTPTALTNRPDDGWDWVGPHTKDYMGWVILEQYGGMCLDLDTFCLANCDDLLGDRQMVIPTDYADLSASIAPYNSAILIAAENSALAFKARTEALERLHRQPADFPWGTTGPFLASKFATTFSTQVVTPPFRVLGGFESRESSVLFHEGSGTIDPSVRVIHMFAQHNRTQCQDITPEYILTSNSMLARTVRESIPNRDLLDPLTAWSVNSWMVARGNHYKAMFRYLQTHECKNILETGTNSGENAVGMIRTSLSPSTEIRYFGFDLFEPHDKMTEAIEFSTGYHNPPSVADVKACIEKVTHAHVDLYKGNTRETLPKVSGSLPKMDFIYLDGGHSLETIASDFSYAEQMLAEKGIIFMDDYFTELRCTGCAAFVDGLDRTKYDVTVYPEIDNYPAAWGRLRTQLASVRLK